MQELKRIFSIELHKDEEECYIDIERFLLENGVADCRIMLENSRREQRQMLANSEANHYPRFLIENTKARQHQTAKGSFVCEICLKGFQTLNGLNNHMQNAKHFQCPVCLSKFKKKGLIKHQRTKLHW